MNFRKGQVEFIVIIALVIIAISAVILVSRISVVPAPPTPGLPEEAKLVKDSVVNLIRAGVKDQLTLIYNQGGMLSPSVSVEFGMFDTQVWSACGETNIPDVSREVGAGLWSYIRQNLEDEMEFFGKNVKFDFVNPRYDVDIFKDRVNIKIYLPTTVEDYEIQQPYEVSVATKLYDILEFSEDFVNDRGEDRLFETVTITSMVHSNPEHENWIPVAGMQTGCGNILFKSRNDVLPGIEGVIKYTVEHVVWNTPGLRTAENPFYPIYGAGGEFYPDLEVAFAYPPSWGSEIDRYFMFAPDPLRVIPKPVMPMVPICIGPYAVSYSFRYPVIVMVEDSTLNQWFNFAMMVDIQNTQPGNCSAEFGEETEYTRVCSNPNCDARITVKNSTGSPIEGADVSFYICDLGLTDENGVVEAKIPCMVSELHVYKEGYRSYGDLFRQDEVEDIDVSLEKMADSVTIHLKGLATDANLPSLGEGIFSGYSPITGATSSDITDSGSFDGKDLIVIISFSPAYPNIFTGEDTSLILSNYDEEGNLISDITTPGLQPVEYNVTASVADNETGRPLGYINTTFELGEDENEIYVYLPVVLKVDGNDWGDDDPGVSPEESGKLTTMLINHCLDPIVSTEETC
jgi:hypothetical protein